MGFYVLKNKIMEITELQQEKKELQLSILKLLEAFSRKTNGFVLEMNTHFVYQQFNDKSKGLVRIDLEINVIV
jgi:hypothetical protein